MDPRRLVLLAVAALGLAACATSTFRPAFRNAEAGRLAFRAGDTVLAMVVSADEALSWGAEEALARELGKRGVKGVASYSVVSDEIVQDRHKAAPTIRGEVERLRANAGGTTARIRFFCVTVSRRTGGS